MITTDKLVKNYGKLPAVNDISLKINEGEIFGLVGPDGAGKTTTIRMLIGILAPTSGSLSVLGAANPETVKSNIGYVPQKFSLYGDLTVMENIQVFGSLYGRTPKEIDDLAKFVLGFTKLLPFKDRLADNLSGGMKQKLALAAGLMHKPKLFFLDEPTTGVDPVSRREFWQMLYRLNKEGTTIFVSTPYMDEAELCSRVAFMHDGRIIRCDSPKNLRLAYPYKILELNSSNRNLRQHLLNCPVLDSNMFGNTYHLVVKDPAAAIPKIRAALSTNEISFETLKEIPPTLEDVFVALASEAV